MACDLFYRGTFDPPTLGHLNVLVSAINKYKPDRVVVVFNNYSNGKKYKAPVSTRIQMFKAMTEDITTQHNTTQLNGTASDRLVKHTSTKHNGSKHSTTRHNTTQHKVEMVFYVSTDECEIGYNQIRDSKIYDKKDLIMLSGVDVLLRWRSSCKDKDRIAVVYRQHSATQHNTTPNLGNQHNTTQHVISQHNTTQHNTTSECTEEELTELVSELNNELGKDIVEILRCDTTQHNTTSSTRAREMLKSKSTDLLEVLHPEVLPIATESGCYR